ncbi:hypothetical protein V8E36_008739 [Tilletia maclaganii]
MNTRATPTREGERRARLLTAGELGNTTAHSASQSVSETGSRGAATSRGSATKRTGSAARRRSSAAMAQAADASTNANASPSGSGARVISSFYLSQDTRNRRNGRRSSGSSSAGQHDEDDDSLAQRAAAASPRHVSQRRLADLSALTNSDDEDQSRAGRSFTRESNYANRLDASAAHIGHLLRRNGRSHKGKERQQERRHSDVEDEEDEDVRQELERRADGDEEDDPDDNGEMSDPNAQKRKHGHRSSAAGPSRQAVQGREPLREERNQLPLLPPANGPIRNIYPRLNAQQGANWPGRIRRLASSARRVLLQNLLHILFALAMIAYVYTNGPRTSSAGDAPSSKALGSISKTTSKLSQRLASFESQLSKYGKTQEQHSSNIGALTARVSTLELGAKETDELVRKWRTELKQGRTREEAELSKWKKEVAQALSDERDALQAQLAKLRAELAPQGRANPQAGSHDQTASAQPASSAEWKAQIKKYDAEMQRVDDRLAVVEADLAETQRALSELDERSSGAVKRADEALRLITNDPTAWLAGHLPALVPVRRVLRPPSVQKGAKGGSQATEFQIDEDFWRELRGQFATPSDVRKAVEAQKNSVSQGQPVLSAKAVLKQAKPDIHAMVTDETRQAVNSAVTEGTFINRSTFMVLLEKELRRAGAALEEKIQAAADDVQAERTDREKAIKGIQDAQDELAKKVHNAAEHKTTSKDVTKWSFSWRRSGQPADTSEADDETDRLEADRQAASETRARVIELIDQALEMYSLDRLGRPDYALFSAGARVIPALTSASYGQTTSESTIPAPKPWSWPLRKASPATSTPELPNRGRPPVTALHPDISPGMCWAFPGSRGTLGIKLAYPSVRVSHVTVEHAPEKLLVPASTASTDDRQSHVRSAPRRIHVWGRVVGGPVEFARAQAMAARQAADDSRAQSRWAGAGTQDSDEEAGPEGAKSGHWIRLGRFEYEAGGNKWSAFSTPSRRTNAHIQTFVIDAAVAAQNFAVDAVQVSVLSNHGNEAYTCLYRVRVHGEPAEVSEDASPYSDDDGLGPSFGGWV